MSTRAIVSRHLLDLGAVPLHDFLSAPYTYPRSCSSAREPILSAEALTSGPNPSVETQLKEGSEGLLSKTAAAAAARNDQRGSKRKREGGGKEGQKAQIAPAVQEYELEEGELIEEGGKKKKKKKRKKNKSGKPLGEGE